MILGGICKLSEALGHIFLLAFLFMLKVNMGWDQLWLHHTMTSQNMLDHIPGKFEEVHYNYHPWKKYKESRHVVNHQEHEMTPYPPCSLCEEHIKCFKRFKIAMY